MKKLIIVFLILLTGCGPAKKLVKTDSRTEIETAIKKVDTTRTESAWQSVVDQIVSQIDLSKIRIVTYYPTVDSTGKQAIKEDVTIEKNVVTSSQTKSTEQAIITEDVVKSVEISQTFQNREIETIKEKKTGLPLKYYFIGFILLAGIIYLAYRFIRHQFF
jgi:hypothetical protein